MQNDTQRHQPPFTAKRTTVTTDRKADAEAGHRRCSSQDSIPSEISQCGASAIAARCISTCSALHPAHRPSAILTAPAIPRLRNKSAAPCHQVSIPLQTPPSAPPIPLQVNPSPTARQSPPLSYFHTKTSLITTHQRQTPNPELSLYIPTTLLPYTHNGNPLSLSRITVRHSPQKTRP